MHFTARSAELLFYVLPNWFSSETVKLKSKVRYVKYVRGIAGKSKRIE